MMQVIELARTGSSDEFSLSEREEAVPGPGEVQIKIKAASLQPFDSTSGLVLGYDVAGIVGDVGEGVCDLHSGDEVWSYLGCPSHPTVYSDLVCVPQQWVSRKPILLSFAEAAAVPTVGLSAYEAVVIRAQVGQGDAVLVTGGSGPLGSMIVELCRHRGAGPILVTSGSDRSFRELTERLKVPSEHVIRYHGRTLDELQEQVSLLNQGRGVRAAFDLVGHRLSQLCYRSIGFGGSVVSVRDQPGEVGDETARWLFSKSASLHFQFTGARAQWGGPEHWTTYQRYLRALTGLFEGGHLSHPKISDLGEFSPSTLDGAHSLLPRADALGQLVVRIGDKGWPKVAQANG